MIYVWIILVVLAYWFYKKSVAKKARANFIDEARKRVNYYVIALLAKIAKSDGRISEEEAGIITQILDENAKDRAERDFLKASFNEHKDNLNDAFRVATEFLQDVPLPRNERLNILGVLVFMALVDEDFSTRKQEILAQIARAFNVSQAELDSIIKNISHLKNPNKTLTLDQAYELLELDRNADLNLVKKQYRTLAKRYHPDILNANNVSKEELEQGVKKFREINEAYEMIKKHLGG